MFILPPLSENWKSLTKFWFSISTSGYLRDVTDGSNESIFLDYFKKQGLVSRTQADHIENSLFLQKRFVVQFYSVRWLWVCFYHILQCFERLRENQNKCVKIKTNWNFSLKFCQHGHPKSFVHDKVWSHSIFERKRKRRAELTY